MESFSGNISGIVAIVFFTSFVKIATTLSIVRYGVGLAGSGMGIVILILSLALSMVSTVGPVTQLGGIDGLLDGRALRGREVLEAFGPYVRARIDNDILLRVTKIAQSGAAQAEGAEPKKEGSPSSNILSAVECASFLLSEVSAAFAIGLLIVIPFLVVDLIVVNILMAMGVTQLPALAVSLPLKLLLFVAVDGWGRITERILT